MRGEHTSPQGVVHPLWKEAECEKGKKGFSSPFLILLGRPIWGAHQPLVAGAFTLLAHKAHIFCRGCAEPLSVPPETLPMSEYYRHIDQSLPLDHFKTPPHVYDLIRDCEQHSFTKSHNSYNIISSSNVKRADPTGLRTMHT